MKTARLICFAVAVLLGLAGTSMARDAGEQKRIDFLIDGLGNLPGAVFIRNGTDYKASDAQHHLRLKLTSVGERVKTAEQFIKYCASESSMSHRPYQIRFADGRTMDTAVYFGDRLKEFDARMK